MIAFLQSALSTVADLLPAAAACLFACIVSVFAVPVIVDRIVYYLPLLVRLCRRKDVMLRGIFYTVLEAVMWAFILCCIYFGLRYFRPELFRYALSSRPARIGWLIGTVHLAMRPIQLGRTVKRQFYYGTYMRFITPEAMRAYQRFLTELDTLDAEEVEAQLKTALPYMHRQSALRKLRELRGAADHNL